MKYRKATHEDLKLLMDIRLEMLRRVNDLPDDYTFSESMILSSENYFKEGNQTTFLAMEEEKAVACATLSYLEVMPTFSHPTGKRAHLMNVYTNSNYRRRGIARKLVQKLIDEAKEKGVTEINLDATAMGRPLYEKLGFVASSECMVKCL